MVPFIKNLRLPLNIIVYDIHFKIYWKYKAAKIVDDYFDFKPKSIAKHYKSRSLIRTFIRNGFFKKFDFCRGCRGRLKRTELLSNIKWFVRIHFFGLSTRLKLVVALFKRIFRYFPFLKHAFQSRPKITQQQSCQFFTVKFKKSYIILRHCYRRKKEWWKHTWVECFGKLSSHYRNKYGAHCKRSTSLWIILVRIIFFLCLFLEIKTL